MNTNRLLPLKKFGQSVWLDYLSRDLIESGELLRLVQEDGIAGVTSNPAIFEKAINGSKVYDQTIARLSKEGLDIESIYRQITLRDIADAADLLHPVFAASNGADGFVSLEVSPHLAYDSDATVREAHELWGLLDRENVMIKVPATPAGLMAIRQLISDGININVTLLFGLSRYREVCEAYLAGLEARVLAKKSIHSVASVASFFLSRIDSLVDPLLEKMDELEEASQFMGKAAIASAKLAYQYYQDFFTSQRFQVLADQGARPQRLLWASTSTKNPAYPDTQYVDSLIGYNTVNTMPMQTINAYRDHGQPAERLTADTDEAQAVLTGLINSGVDIDVIEHQLEKEGIEKFIDPYDKLFRSLQQKAGKTGK
tara:strand:- start:72628 stop:73740 length:1113 start_codon:yes stop_codon:yes gene_type:complete